MFLFQNARSRRRAEYSFGEHSFFEHGTPFLALTELKLVSAERKGAEKKQAAGVVVFPQAYVRSMGPGNTITPLPQTCVKMEPFVLLAFFPQFYSICSVFGVYKGPFGGSKRQKVVQGPKKEPNCLQNKGKSNKPTNGQITGTDLKSDKSL